MMPAACYFQFEQVVFNFSIFESLDSALNKWWCTQIGTNLVQFQCTRNFDLTIFQSPSKIDNSQMCWIYNNYMLFAIEGLSRQTINVEINFRKMFNVWKINLPRNISSTVYLQRARVAGAQQIYLQRWMHARSTHKNRKSLFWKLNCCRRWVVYIALIFIYMRLIRSYVLSRWHYYSSKSKVKRKRQTKYLINFNHTHTHTRLNRFKSATMMKIRTWHACTQKSSSQSGKRNKNFGYCTPCIRNKAWK